MEPNNFGIVELRVSNDKPRLVCRVTPKVKFDVTPFNGDKYVHISARGKITSISVKELEELGNTIPRIKEKLHHLDVEPITPPQAKRHPAFQAPQGAVRVSHVSQGAVQEPSGGHQGATGTVQAPPGAFQGPPSGAVQTTPPGTLRGPSSAVPGPSGLIYNIIEEDYAQYF